MKCQRGGTRTLWGVTVMKHTDMGAEGGRDKTKQKNKEDGAPENKGIGKMNGSFS